MGLLGNILTAPIRILTAPARLIVKGIGSLNEGGFIPAHFNSNEISKLSEAQGGEIKTSDGMNVINLDDVFSNPFVIKSIAGKFRGGGYTTGYSKFGRSGDTKIALVADKTSKILDSLINGTSINPKTGFKEYFALGPVMAGLEAGSTILKTIFPSLESEGMKNSVKELNDRLGDFNFDLNDMETLYQLEEFAQKGNPKYKNIEVPKASGFQQAVQSIGESVLPKLINSALGKVTIGGAKEGGDIRRNWRNDY